MLARSNRTLALAVAPWDERIAGLAARDLFKAANGAPSRGQADRLARRALLAEPTSVAAMMTIGLNALLTGHSTTAQSSLELADRLSRRDLETRVWKIEDAVARSDITGAVRNYDIALRTSRFAPEVLFPVLAAALSEPAIRASLARTLANGAPWAPEFINFAASRGTDPSATGAFLQALRQRGFGVDVTADAAVVSGLLNQRRFDRAWSYYALLRTGAARNRSRDPMFAQTPLGALPFDWMIVADGGVVADVQQSAGRGMVEYSAPPGISGPVIEQLQFLPPGRYRIEGSGRESDIAAPVNPYWTLRCRDGGELGRVDVAGSGANGTFEGEVIVPASCPIQVLTLMLRPSDALGGASGRLDRLRLVPAL